MTPDKRVEETENRLITAMGMMSENMQRQALGQSMAYTEEDFIALTQRDQDMMSEVVENEDMSNSIFRIVHELALIKEIKPAHIVEATDSIVEAIKFFAKIDGGRLHFIDLEKRVSDKKAQTIIKSK